MNLNHIYNMQNKLTLLLILLSFLTNAQETQFTFNNEKGMTDFIITPVEGKTAPEIYKKIIDWIKITYKNPDSVILSTIENEYVRFEGVSNSVYALNIPLSGKTYDRAKYQIEISIKDSKYKFDLIDLKTYTQPNSISPGGWRDQVLFTSNSTEKQISPYFKNDGTLKNLFKYYSEVPNYFNNLNKSILEQFNPKATNQTNW